MKRRAFIKNTALASSLIFVPEFIQAAAKKASISKGYKRLVIVQFSGGNDGLNTVIPYSNDLYYKKRKTIAIQKKDLLPLSDELAFPKNMAPLKQLFDQGYLSILNNVGYPNPNRSHFQSMDIWHTASDSDKYIASGWIGRYLDTYGKHPYNAIEIDDQLSLAMKGNTKNGIATKDPKILYRSSQDPFFKKVLRAYNEQQKDNLEYLYSTMIDAESSAKYIFETSRTFHTHQEYPQNPLANQLRTAAKFINAGLDTRVYYTSLNGFDTHAGQLNKQNRLLGIYAESMEAFINDLKQNNTFKDTLIMTFSEFGRRVAQNAANGTDHGTANNVFLIGEDLKQKGIYNEAPDLSDLDGNGDLKHSIDFRSIYATILNKWLLTDDRVILNQQKFPLLDLI